MTQRAGIDAGGIHMNRPSGEPRPGTRALCGADDRHGVMTTYARVHVTCDRCLELHAGYMRGTTDSIEDAVQR